MLHWEVQKVCCLLGIRGSQWKLQNQSGPETQQPASNFDHGEPNFPLLELAFGIWFLRSTALPTHFLATCPDRAVFLNSALILRD